MPGTDEWVLVLGEADDAGHWKLGAVEAGERFAFQGRVFETADADGDGLIEVRPTGDVLGRVVHTFVCIAPEVIDAEIEYADGSSDTLTGTPNHPFWVDAVRSYVPLGEMEVGTVLHVQGGGEAILVSKTWRQDDFEAFDVEVDGLHNFYVRGSGSDAAGVLVHNSTAKETVALDTNAIIAAVEGGQDVLNGRNAATPITAVKEFFVGGGDKQALRSYLQDNGGSVIAGSQQTARGLQQRAADAGGRVIRGADAQVAAGAVDHGMTLITNDRKLRKNMNAIGESAEGF
ncbi:MAG: hypothetical protein KTR31_26985 [Myxococcales bacterium]|nr:hypothetical protein [Myxococcales bacterium]